MKLSPLSPSLQALFAGLPLGRRQALVKYGGGVVQFSGKLGGNVFAYGPGGKIVRTWSMPTDPATEQQVEMRDILRDLVERWTDDLSQAERDNWDIYGDNVPVLNRLGESVFRSGQNWFIGANSIRMQADLVNLPIVDAAPGDFNRGEFTAPTINAWNLGANQVDIDFTVADDWVNEDDSAGILFVSRPQNPSINFFKGPYRRGGYILGDLAAPPASPIATTLPFDVIAGQKVFFKFVVTRADGRYSTAYTFSGIAV